MIAETVPYDPPHIHVPTHKSGKAKQDPRTVCCSVMYNLLSCRSIGLKRDQQVRGCFLSGDRHGSASWRGPVDGAGYGT